MTEGPGSTGANLRLARQARGFSQQQLASMAGVTDDVVARADRVVAAVREEISR